MNKRKLVKKRIQELIPDIMKLKFGCELKMKDCDGEVHNVVYINYDYVYFKKDNTTGSYEKEWVVEKLGRQITLEDCLHILSIISKNEINKLGMTRIGIHEEESMMYKWERYKTFDKQHNTFIEYIYEILFPVD